MKKSILPAFVLCLALLTACSIAEPASTPDIEETEPTAEGLVDQPPWFATFRVVSGGETGELILAANDGTSGEVYVLNTEGVSLDQPVENGELINVYYEAVMETFPARFSNVTGVEHTRTERDDRCGLYLQVLDDLWQVDPGLNTGLEELAVDFSGLTDLSDSEKAAVAWAFGSAHGLTPITGTWEELVEAGYIDGENLCWNGNGCLFTLSGSADETFQAEKWASGLGAYAFNDCTARMGEDGDWTYSVGSHLIA